MSTKLSLKYLRGPKSTSKNNVSAILSSNYDRKSISSSSSSIFPNVTRLQAESTRIFNIDEYSLMTEDSENLDMTEDVTRYYTADEDDECDDEDDEEDDGETASNLKQLLFSGKKCPRSELFRKKEILASDSEDDEIEQKTFPSKRRMKRSSILGQHEVILISSESDCDIEINHQQDNNNRMAKVEGWLATSPIAASPATPARIILSSSSENDDDNDVDTIPKRDRIQPKNLMEDLDLTDATSNNNVLLTSMMSSMSLDPSSSKNRETMETIHEEDEEDDEYDDGEMQVRIQRVVVTEPVRKSMAVQVELSSSDDDNNEDEETKKSVSIQVDLESSSSSSHPESSEDSDEAFKAFLSSVRQKYQLNREKEDERRQRSLRPLDDFIVQDEIDEDDENSSSSSSSHPPLVLSEDEEEVGREKEAAFVNEPPEIIILSPDSGKSLQNGQEVEQICNEKTEYATFLQSLTKDFSEERRHPAAIKYVRNYNAHKVELCARLYKLFNEEVFNGLLPSDMEIRWNPRLRKTAGLCAQKCRYMDKDKRVILDRSSRLELSTKVLDSGDRLRDTLIHEMCHAAAWTINGYRDGHGPIWKSWANKAMCRFPELPIIDRCHNYQIRTKYTYKCKECGYTIGRHSKSLDMARKCCGYCRGEFVLFVNYKNNNSTPVKGGNDLAPPQTPKTPNAFALFVKDNYKKHKRSGVTHSEVMKILSAKFQEHKLQVK